MKIQRSQFNGTVVAPDTPEDDEEERRRIVQVRGETNGIVAGPRGVKGTRLGMKRTMPPPSRMQRPGTRFTGVVTVLQEHA